MNTFDPIPLDTHWQLNNDDVFFSLADWPQHSLRPDETVELRRMFNLEPIGEVCLRFYLYVRGAPEGTVVSMNGWTIGRVEADKLFVANVTDEVTLEDNVLTLRVSQSGRFGKVGLERLPCGNPWSLD